MGVNDVGEISEQRKQRQVDHVWRMQQQKQWGLLVDRYRGVKKAEKERRKQNAFCHQAGTRAIHIAEHNLIHLAKLGTALNRARKDAMSGDYEMALQQVDAVIKEMHFVAPQIDLIQKQLEKACGFVVKESVND